MSNVKKNTNRTIQAEHTFPPVSDERSHILILGTMPSEASRAAGFYYMHPRNRFWAVMSAILQEDLVGRTKAEKTEILLDRGVALYDVVLSCKISHSEDASIRDVRPADIPAILRQAKIERIFLNGKKAYALFHKFFPEYEEIARCLPSTSPANAACALPALTEIWREAIEPILDR